MISVSSDFKTAVRQFGKEFRSYLTDGSDQINDEDDLINLIFTIDGGLCRTVMRQLEFSYYGSHDYLEEYVSPSIGVVLPNTSVEYIDFGGFKVKSINEDQSNNRTDALAYDRMYEALQKYDLDPIYDLVFPCTVSELLTAICTRLGWTTDITTFPNSDLEIATDKFTANKLTFRGVLNMIAEASGSILFFREDTLKIKQVTSTEIDTLATEDLTQSKIDALYGELNSIVLSLMPQEDNIVQKDDTSIGTYGLNEFKIVNNLITGETNEERETSITDIYDTLVGLKYYPSEFKADGICYYEIGDVIALTSLDDSTRNTLITKIILSFEGGLTVDFESKIPTQSTTPYDYAGVIGQKIFKTEIIVDKVNNEITLVVEDTTSLKLSTEAISLVAQASLDLAEANSELITDLQTDMATLELRADGLEIGVESIGGVNLLLNSVGLKGTIQEWQNLDENGDLIDADNDATILSTTDVQNNSESGSALRLDEQYVEQTRPTIIGETYTYYCRFQKDGDCNVTISSVEGIIPLTAGGYVDGDWAVFKYQFVASESSTTLRISNVGETGAYAIITDSILKKGDVSGWSQAPGEVMGTGYKFDKDGLTLSSASSTFKLVVDNEKITVFDTAGGGNKIIMQVSKDLGKMTNLTVQDSLVVQRYENSDKSARMIPTDTGLMLVIND